MEHAEKTAAIDQLIKALNDAEPAAFALMDYWTFDGWFALKTRLQEAGAPALNKKVFPGIELRLVSPTTYRLNAHVIFSDSMTDQELRDFKSELCVALVDRPLSDESLVELARKRVGADILKEHGFDKAEVDEIAATALQAGSTIAEIVAESYKSSIAKVPDGKAIGFMPWDTSDGLAKADWHTHYAYVISLMQTSPIFETRREELWAAFAGQEVEANKEWFTAFQSALGNVPRLAVAGSDAHSFADYGVFPSGKATWIKADPTFQGLLQAIREPARRSYIGKSPPKLQEVENNKTYFIDALRIDKTDGSKLPETWFDGSRIPLNPDLIAIIGNKGSGKSALADVIALLGNSKSSKHFSFLTPDRFRQKPNMLAGNFKATLTWRDGTTEARVLSQDAPVETPELVRYIPQAFFEDLCNSHISGNSDAFETELRAVIFSHTGEAERQGALDFDQLLRAQEQPSRDALVEFRKELRVLNGEIERIEEEMAPNRRKGVDELLALKEKELQEHEKLKPATVVPPADELTSDQKAATQGLSELAQQLEDLAKEERTVASESAANNARAKAAEALKERIKLFKRQAKQLEDEMESHLGVLGLSFQQVFDIRVLEAPIDEAAAVIKKRSNDLSSRLEAIGPKRKELVEKQDSFKAQLNAPQQAYQQHLAVVKAWQEKRDALVGNAQTAESLSGLKARIGYLESLPVILAGKIAARKALAGEILVEIQKLRQARSILFRPVQEVIDANKLIRDDYKLQFKATLAMSAATFSERVFSMIKQNFGPFKGEAESHSELHKVVEVRDINNGNEAIALVDEVLGKITSGLHAAPSGVGLERAMRVNRKPSELYDFLYGFEFIEPRYTLLFQDTNIEHLSPGQRGALLLIFYLLVDTGHNPIILDQPEENLDNETLVSLLVPVLSEAKKRRQIIMVTHNPNLAVVCDAEQIIYSSFDRKSKSLIQYSSGGIESPQMNEHVVNVLEGTKVAFDNRGGKYH
jgi:ABC-type lipoprotein export system ATPase subunit